MTEPEQETPYLAVIGMAGRFPGASGLDEFWRALATGTELLTTVDGVAHGVVDGGDLFDPAFFDYAPSEAVLIDPQQRVFLECAWEALEHAGQVPGDDAVIGVYAGSGDTDHLDRLRAHRDRFPDASELQFRLASGVDFLTSRVAYKLGLTGPAVTVQTACATSLVAVHTAAQALLAGECDVALAGGVTLHVPFPTDEPGEDGIIAPDGHCRPFDAAASGTIASDGAGVVVLKRLDDALADGDPVHAVLLGSAVTNDGTAKVGFAAPSVAGQAAAVRAAHEVAGIDPTSVSYVEAHGTGTPVGDPIEVRALTKAFGADGRCLLGSVKANIGHTDTAAGVLGLIKVVLALRAGEIPPTPHFTTPNPELGLDEGPFAVAAERVPWPRTALPRRAGVHSIGLGGTNVHVVVQEPPVRASSPGRTHQVFPVSGRTAEAAARAADQVAEHVRVSGDPLPDMAWTLQTGRRAFSHRAFVTGSSAALGDASDVAEARDRGVVFLFPGQGGQHVGMGAELYREEPVFAAVVDECAALAAPDLGLDLRDVLFGALPDAARRLATMQVGQPAVFAVELGLARLWESWGVRPDAVLGHSLGAYAAAAVAGVFDTGGALALVLERGRILGGLPAGAMLALPLAPAELTPLLGDDLSLAAVNGPEQSVVAGPVEAVERLRVRMAADGVTGSLLHISTAAHSHLVEPELVRLEKAVAGMTPVVPRIPWISDRTGRLVTADEAVDPTFWSAHLRGTVAFSAALDTAFADGDRVLLEVGPGRTLAGLARRHPAGAGRVVAASMPHVADELPEQAVLATALGKLWQAGVDVDWAAVHEGEQRLRVPMPTYPFQRVSLLVDRDLPAMATAAVLADDADPLEHAVATAFGQVLGLSGLDRNADFFELGGDSLLAVRVVAALKRDLAVDLPAKTVFRAPTVAALATLVREVPR